MQHKTLKIFKFVILHKPRWQAGKNICKITTRTVITALPTIAVKKPPDDAEAYREALNYSVFPLRIYSAVTVNS